MSVSDSEFPGQGDSNTGTIQPVYSVVGSVTQKWMRKVIQAGADAVQRHDQ
jgi:ATP-dependent DNA helicase RecG